jgi:two-component system chemotaxis response regulator CheB
MVPANVTRTRAPRRSLRSGQSDPLRHLDAVVVGASAGGVEALGAILPVLPAETPFAVVVVLHVLRDRPSELANLFGPRCTLPVREASDKEPVAAGVIWFAPPDYHLLVESDRSFSLSLEAPVKHSRPAIDPLFESAARVYGSRLAGIVLTGASDDGAEGVASIREEGGVVLVQDPATAEFPVMPSAALARVEPDAIGTATEIAAMLCTAAIRGR